MMPFEPPISPISPISAASSFDNNSLRSHSDSADLVIMNDEERADLPTERLSRTIYAHVFFTFCGSRYEIAGLN